VRDTKHTSINVLAPRALRPKATPIGVNDDKLREANRKLRPQTKTIAKYAGIQDLVGAEGMYLFLSLGVASETQPVVETTVCV
jgi:hypothetical protein